MSQPCEVPECEEPMRARKLCNTHYRRWKRTGVTGTPTSPIPKHLRECSIPTCTKIASGGRGWCPMHWRRWRKWGDPLTHDHRQSISLDKRLWPRIRLVGECWEWQGAKNPEGYGRILLSGKIDYVHRVAYEALVHEIPNGLTLDHLCRKRDCCNPWHLEPVTQAENNRRARAAA